MTKLSAENSEARPKLFEMRLLLGIDATRCYILITDSTPHRLYYYERLISEICDMRYVKIN